MKVKEYLNQQVSTFYTAEGQEIINTTMASIFFETKDFYGKIVSSAAELSKDKVLEVRRILNKYGTEAYLRQKKNLPCWIPCGCVIGDAKDESMVSFTNIISIDIDHLTEEEQKSFRQKYFEEPWVVAILKSLSGNGLYVLLAVENIKDIKGYVRYLTKMFNINYNIEIDSKVSNLARKRFISWEEDIEKWIKPFDYEITPWKLKLKEEEPIVQEESYKPANLSKLSEEVAIERTRKAIWALLNNGYTVKDYGAWYYVGCDLAAFSDREAMFDKLCNNYGKQNKDAVKNTWKHCLENPSTINDDLHRKWQGMAKNQLGQDWWRNS